MSDTALLQIEKSIEGLTTDEQLLLISRLAEKLRKHEQSESAFEAELAEMAADEEIQAELRRIEEDFAVADMDGLAE